MKGTDRFLIGIVAGAAALVIVAFLVALLKPGPAFRPDDSPEGAAHNYLLALQRADYERAYSYLSPTLAGYPADAGAFAEDVDRFGWNFNRGEGATLRVESARITGERAVVTVEETAFYQGGLFDSSQHSTTFQITLRREAAGWRIVQADSYWAWCWTQPDSCQ
ncbi:MAG: nuclear transport factor 2 family protein [Chloroflexi bacterium]|nr:nuclear transport factor 2 family protein [Chloroflexota bacterium]